MLSCGGVNMIDNHGHEPAREPNDLGRFFVERANAADLEGLVALYTPDAVLEFPPGEIAVGTEAIRATFERMLASRPTFQPGQQAPALVSGDVALTSTRGASGGITAEVARRQPDGSWLWAVDQPRING
jgi:ketosteroid isomerase-like protein